MLRSIFNLFGSTISWNSSLQFVVALSTTKAKAEYMAMVEAVKENIWLKGIIVEFGIYQKSVNIINCDI